MNNIFQLYLSFHQIRLTILFNIDFQLNKPAYYWQTATTASH